MRSDKMQMSYVPQVTEHIQFTECAVRIDGSTPSTVTKDIVVPETSIIEKCVVILETRFNSSNVTATMKIGSTADDDLFTPSTIALSTGTANSKTILDPQQEAIPQKFMVPASSLAADRIVRFTLMNSGTGAETGKSCYCYIQYRFPSNGIPTRIA